MGSWNGTCGISQLPILSGAKVKTFLLLQSEFSNNVGGAGVCYSTAYFRPWFFPVSAEYNDYGSIDNIQKDWNSEYMLATFQKWLAEGKVKLLGAAAEINDPGITKFDKLEDVFDCVERGALVFNLSTEKLDPEKKEWVPKTLELKIGMFMVLDGVLNSVVDEAIRFMSRKENKYYLDEEAKTRQKALKAIAQVREKGVPTDEFSITLYDMSVDRLMGGLIEEHCAFKHYKSILYAPDKVAVEDFMTRLDESNYTGMAMTYLRKLWIPQTGQGSQSEELSFNKALVYAMNKHFELREVEEEQARKEYAEWEKKYQAEQAAKKKKTKKKKKL